jgi:signal transduction histidine kinase
MIISSFAIYLSTAGFRKDDFHTRLTNSALNRANLLFQEYEVDYKRVIKIEKNDPVNLHNEKVIILNFRNDTIYSSDKNGGIEIKKGIIEHIKSGDKVSFRQGLTDVTGFLYFTNYDRFVILAAATDIEGTLHLEKLKIILIIVCLTSLLLFFIIGWYSSGEAIKPISEVVKKVEEISISSLNLRVPEGKSTDEIGRLAKTFNKMLERLETSFGTQKNFIANASHELRTPLTSINGQLEVLMMKDRSTAEYRSTLVSVLEDIKSLIDLSNRLLLIARTSAEGPMNINKKIRIDEILWQTREEIQKFNSDYHVKISMDDSLTDSNQMIVVGDEYLLKIAVSNIIDNACKYSPQHTVNIKIHHIEKWIEVIFEDEGIGISQGDLQKVFEPFFRGTNAFSISGYGIGLPLVDQIIKNHNGKIELSSRIGKGTIVTVLIPTIS